MEKLKPCPFCGGEAKVQRFPRNYSVYCTECGARTMSFKPTEEEAVEDWNRRVSDDERRSG